MRTTTGKGCRSSWVVGAALLACGGCESDGPDAVRGGLLYDNWWQTTGQEEPQGDHPLWASRPDTETNTRTGAETWRCKECHGWDYEGVDGAYGSGSHRTGITGIHEHDLDTPALVALLTDPNGHAYGEVLDEGAVADLAAFVRESLVDTSMFIGGDGTFTGDVGLGERFFNRCAQCHGDDGLSIPPGGHEEFEDFPGLIANDNPQEFLHKVRFGQPGTEMPPQADELSHDDLASLGAFVQTLPQGR